MHKIREKIGLNAATLKWVAIILMFLNHLCISLADHGVAGYFVTDAHWYLTRIAFIIFAFQISEGFHYTRNKFKYILYIFAFALLAEIPYDLCFSGKVFEITDQNVLWTLGFGSLVILGIDQCKRNPYYSILITFIGMVVCQILCTDYSALGIATIASFYYFRECRWKQLVFTLVVFAVINITDYMHFFYVDGYTIAEMFGSKDFWVKVVRELHALAAWPLLLLYNGKKGRNINKWFFYGFYPGHLLLIFLLSLLI